MGFACFSLQVIATTCYTYSIDSYGKEISETSQLFSFIRQTFGFTYASYVVDLCEKIGKQWVFVLFVGFGSVLAFVPVVGLTWKGRERRENLGEPRNVNALDTKKMQSRDRIGKMGKEKKLDEV